jgi:cobalt-zinc-cadmium efflux system membrane fusion protein
MRAFVSFVSTSLLLGSVASFSGGCSGDAAAVETFTPGPSAPEADGKVKIQPGSRPYVKVVTLAPTPEASTQRAPARVEFRDGAVSRVGAPIGGRVSAIAVKVGDHVVAGQPLVTLSSPDATAVRSQLAAAQLARDTAKRELDRQVQMEGQGVGVASERAAAEAHLREAEVEVVRAQNAAAYLGGGGGPTVVVRSPISGTVLSRHATVGAYAEPGGEELLQIGDPHALWVVADVFERNLPLLSEGVSATVELAAETAPLTGKVTTIGSVLDDDLHTAHVYVTLDQTPADLRPGMSGSATLKSHGDDALVVPVASVLVKEGRKHIVYVQVGEDEFAARTVTVGPVVDGKVAVLSGLAAGDKVVVDGALLLDGASEQLL